MLNAYDGVNTRLLQKDERLILSNETDMPLVIAATDFSDVASLQVFLKQNSQKILDDIANFGAVLLRGFAINSDADFEKTILSIDGLNGISEAFMAEEGRIHVDDLRYILHTNVVYKTGGTLYLGGFHSENYYSTDVPAYICFCSLKPSTLGGETGLINMEKIYSLMSDNLKQKLEKQTFFVTKWLVSEIAARYHLSDDIIQKICAKFDLPIVGEGRDKVIIMYKPSVFIHPFTHKKSLQINLFELPTLNTELRKCFIKDYSGKAWFWHRFVWRLPTCVFRIIERLAIMVLSFSYSPKNAINILRLKINLYKAFKKHSSLIDTTKVGSCFDDNDIKELARLIRDNYSSCLWMKGDILLVDNRKVMHAGMPGAGPRLIRAMICNVLDMKYSAQQPGVIDCHERDTETVGFFMQNDHGPKSN